MATPSGSGSKDPRGKGLKGKDLAGKALSGTAASGKDLAGKALSGATQGGKGLAGKAASGAALGATALSGEATAAAGALSGKAAVTGKRGWRSFVPPNSRGKYPWRWRWLGVPLLLGVCMLSGWWAWGRAESQLGERALVHLACEGIDTSDLNIDWSYRSATVDGTLPTGVTADTVKSVIDNGSDNSSCLADAGIDASDDPGVYDVKMLAAAGAAAAVAAPAPAATAVPTAVPTAAPEPTAVPEPTATAAPEPTATAEPEPTATAEPLPVAALAAAAAFNGQTITLSGVVGSEAQRDALVAAAMARAGADNVVDELTIDPGEPSDASDDRISELAQIISAYDGANLVDGSASITDDATTYVLNARTDEARAALSLPGDGTVNVPQAAAPAFTG